MKKHKIQYGFSGFKIKDLVKYIVEYICDMVCAINGKLFSWKIICLPSDCRQFPFRMMSQRGPHLQVRVSPGLWWLPPPACPLNNNGRLLVPPDLQIVLHLLRPHCAAVKVCPKYVPYARLKSVQMPQRKREKERLLLVITSFTRR